MILRAASLLRGGCCALRRGERSHLGDRLCIPLIRSVADGRPKPRHDQQQSRVKDEVFTIPNLITLSRIAASPAISWCILDSRWEMAVAGKGQFRGNSAVTAPQALMLALLRVTLQAFVWQAHPTG
jgi:hypothetical protein